jgi:hypothetical protein
MFQKLPRWGQITLLALGALIVLGLLGLGVYAMSAWLHIWGLLISLAILGGLGAVLYVSLKPLLKYYQFSKKAPQHEALMRQLPGLLQAGRTQEAIARFDDVMNDAPENAYFFYLRAYFFRGVQKQSEALSAAKKALTLMKSDALLAEMIKQGAAQPGAPGSTQEFRENLEQLIDDIEPRLHASRQRREKARADRKKKSR